VAVLDQRGQDGERAHECLVGQVLVDDDGLARPEQVQVFGLIVLVRLHQCFGQLAVVIAVK